MSYKKIIPIKTKIETKLNIPPSKSYTHRALIIGCLSEGKSIIRNIQRSSDTLTTLEALKKLNFNITENNKNARDIEIIGKPLPLINIKKEPIRLNMYGSGTSARFITALCSILPYKVYISGDKSLNKRPMKELISSLKPIGISIKYIDKIGYLPIELEGNPNTNIEELSISGAISSQFISALLIISPLIKDKLIINVKGKTVSQPYIDMTIGLMEKFGVKVYKENSKPCYVVYGNTYKAQEIICEGDYSSASYLLGAVAIIGGKLHLDNLHKNTLQGDSIILNLLSKMNCKTKRLTDKTLLFESYGMLRPINVNMSSYPDLVPIMAIVCAFTEGQSILSNIEHLKYKESNRIESIRMNLNKMGIKTEYIDESLIIYGKDKKKLIADNTKNNDEILINTYDDHRIAMSFAIAGLVKDNILLDNKECVSKSFPEFWSCLDKLYHNNT
jgi:3-phosphoshikimate 1-carboxyvinyltransferase